jgi:hypothetical protein
MQQTFGKFMAMAPLRTQFFGSAATARHFSKTLVSIASIFGISKTQGPSKYLFWDDYLVRNKNHKDFE